MLLNFSDEANAHRSVRFSSRAVHVSSALLFITRMAIIRDFFFDSDFPTKWSAGPYGSYDKKQFFIFWYVLYQCECC